MTGKRRSVKDTLCPDHPEACQLECQMHPQDCNKVTMFGWRLAMQSLRMCRHGRCAARWGRAAAGAAPCLSIYKNLMSSSLLCRSILSMLHCLMKIGKNILSLDSPACDLVCITLSQPLPAHRCYQARWCAQASWTRQYPLRIKQACMRWSVTA